MPLIAYAFPKLKTVKNVVRQMSKNSRFRRPFDKQHGKRSKHCWNLYDNTFIIFIDLSEETWIRKSPSQWYVKS